jgi:uncharacterized membrane protein YhaH (DUF805 family)
MNMMEAVRTCFSKYATFSGRARRAEFWWFSLFNFITSIVLTIIDGLVFGGAGGGMGGGSIDPLSSLYSLAVLVPGLAVGARRLHDTGRSGWWQLLMLIPIVGAIILIVWWASKGNDGTNGHGSNPITG